jgi:hypothetical protein
MEGFEGIAGESQSRYLANSLIRRVFPWVRIPPSPPNKMGLSFRPFLFGGAGCVDEPTGFDKNRGAIFGRRGLAAAVRSEAEDERLSPAASNPTLSAT